MINSKKNPFCKMCGSDIRLTGETYQKHLERAHGFDFTDRNTKGNTIIYYFTPHDILGL